MKELYNEFLPEESLVQWIEKIKEHEVITSHTSIDPQKLSFMVSLISTGLQLPTLIINQSGISRIICDNCSIYDLYEFYNNKIPLKYDFLWSNVAKEYNIKRDLFFFELPKDIYIKFCNAKLQIIKIYTRKPASDPLKNFLSKAYGTM